MKLCPLRRLVIKQIKQIKQTKEGCIGWGGEFSRRREQSVLFTCFRKSNVFSNEGRGVGMSPGGSRRPDCGGFSKP